MTSHLRIQTSQPRQGINPQDKDKNSKNNKITKNVQSLLLDSIHFETGKHSYSYPGKTSSPYEKIAQIIYDVFFPQGPLPSLVQSLIRSYIPIESAGIHFPECVKLNDPQILKELLGESGKNTTPIHFQAALEIVQRVYESPSRFIMSKRHGRAFAADAEILAIAMKLALNQTVLEIGGASGENALL
jgi:hypothetical protein